MKTLPKDWIPEKYHHFSDQVILKLVADLSEFEDDELDDELDIREWAPGSEGHQDLIEALELMQKHNVSTIYDARRREDPRLNPKAETSVSLASEAVRPYKIASPPPSSLSWPASTYVPPRVPHLAAPNPKAYIRRSTRKSLPA